MNTANKSPLNNSPFNNNNQPNNNTLSKSQPNENDKYVSDQDMNSCSSTEDIDMENKEIQQQDQHNKQDIPSLPPPESGYNAQVMIHFDKDEGFIADLQAIYKTLLEEGFKNVKVNEKTKGFLFSFKNTKQKQKFLQNKNLVGKFGTVATDDTRKRKDQNEAILLGIDERFNSLLYLLNSYDDKLIKFQIWRQLSEVADIKINLRNKVSFLTLNCKKKTARILFVKEKTLAEAIGRGVLTIGVSKYVLCLPIERGLRTCRNCCQFGHWEGKCINTSVCIKCAGSHHGSSCITDELECYQCGNNHAATDPRCPIRKNRRKK